MRLSAVAEMAVSVALCALREAGPPGRRANSRVRLSAVAEDPSLTYQVSGLKNGDTAGAVLNGGSLSRVAGENVGVYGINQGGLALNSGK